MARAPNFHPRLRRTIHILFLATHLYLIGLVTSAGVRKGIDDGESVGLEWAALISTALLGVFTVQHTIMAWPTLRRV